jgi:valyl-tRNA synthetase
MNKEMEKKYNHIEAEPRVYKMWEDLDVFSPEGAQKLRERYGFKNRKETFCVLMPPPNANAPLHCGHATYAIQDLMTRFYRMRGYKALYLPGMDHAGFETQVVYERKLKKEGKSRFDFDSETLYENILEFVKENSEVAIDQFKKLGMSADWNRNVFMLEDKVTDLVLETFEKMYKDELVYRDFYLVNYSPIHGTTFSNLETTHKETISPLYYVKYRIKDTDQFITVATVRPETIFADVALAVNPKDKRFKKLVGKKVINPLNEAEMLVIEDPHVDMEFGTGALKVTPGHDFNDFEIGKKNDLKMISVINLEGRMINTSGEVDGLKVKKAREVTAGILEGMGALEKVDEKYTNNLLVDYKDGKPIEPMLLPNWFVKMHDLASEAIESIEGEKVKFNTPLWKNESIRWLKEIKDWPISRQIVFGIRIPVWYNVEENPNIFVRFLDKKGESVEGEVGVLLGKYSTEEISSGLQKLIAPIDAKHEISRESPGEAFLQETDTFDTWFSSGQWPLTTLGFKHDGKHEKDFEEFFPTTLMDSMWDILFFWIARMIMFSLYLTKKIPFEHVYIHGRITDKHGKKMSKSLGNVINPVEFIDKYGADALRMGILVGGNTAARNTSLSEDKVRGYRNFSNKIWNMARFMNLMTVDYGKRVPDFSKKLKLTEEDKELLKELEKLIETSTKGLEEHKFKETGDSLYHFIWDVLADKYIEVVKNREDKDVALSVLHYTFSVCLKLLHPFMPFVTEEVWSHIFEENTPPLAISTWPQH